MVDRELLMQAGVPAKDVKRLDLAWNAFQAATIRDASHTPCVVCTGIYNAGKSTLLNALIGKNIFPTGDIPTTKAVAQAEHGGAVYIDTPGLNAEEEDDQETQSAYGSADFILFVSNAQNGGVSAAEAEWLKKLGERYTADSLKRRLIYVMSHGSQVEPEDLSGIEAHIRGDLEKAVGFVLEQVFCVDSILFQQGREQEEAMLVEGSGIPRLQAYLSEQLAGAEDTLRQAHEAEFAQRRQELSEALETVRAEVQRTYDTQSGHTQEQIAAVDAVWTEFEKKLEHTMPVGKITPIPVPYIRLAKSKTGKASSLMECGRKVKDALRPIYDSMQGKVQQEMRYAEERAKDYLNTGMDSAYFLCCEKINRLFDETMLKLKKRGVAVSDSPEISIPNLSADFRDEVIGYLHRDCVGESMLSLGTYVDKYVWLHELGEPSESTEYQMKKGLFGGMRECEVTVYYYDIFRPSHYMEENLRDSVKFNVDMANQCINQYWADFVNQLKSKANRRKAELKEQINTYRANFQEKSHPADLQAAIDLLSALEREVRA